MGPETEQEEYERLLQDNPLLSEFGARWDVYGIEKEFQDLAFSVARSTLDSMHRAEALKKLLEARFWAFTDMREKTNNRGAADKIKRCKNCLHARQEGMELYCHNRRINDGWFPMRVRPSFVCNLWGSTDV